MVPPASQDDRVWRILLVDDDPDFLRAAKRVLGQSPNLRAKVETAQQIEEVLRIIDEKLFDVVVADYRMEPDDGAKLLRRIQKAKPGLKRVLLTGFDQDALAKAGVQSTDADLVLDKNALLDDLDRKLTEFLERAKNGQGA